MRSMTAYAAARCQKNGQNVQVVVRSLNFKYLDTIIHNLPAEDIPFEEKIKKEVKSFVGRGRVEIFIFLNLNQAPNIQINEQAVKKYIGELKKMGKKYNLKGDIKINEIFNLPQVIFWDKKSKNSWTLIQTALKKALKNLLDFKAKEGKAIQKEIEYNLGKLKKNAEEIKRLKPQATRGDNGKEDIDEEVSLTVFYLGKMETKVKSSKDKLKGKALDFLTQEISRELNAASSKTKNKKTSFLIVESKNYLERIREQAQNIE